MGRRLRSVLLQHACLGPAVRSISHCCTCSAVSADDRCLYLMMELGHDDSADARHGQACARTSVKLLSLITLIRVQIRMLLSLINALIQPGSTATDWRFQAHPQGDLDLGVVQPGIGADAPPTHLLHLHRGNRCPFLISRHTWGICRSTAARVVG